MDLQLQERIVEVVLNLQGNIREEEEIIEELTGTNTLDDEDYAGQIEGYVDEIEGNENALADAHRMAINVLEVLLEDIQQWDQEDDFFFEDDREVLDRGFQRLCLRRFYQFEDVEFQRHFRMSREVFELLIREFQEHLSAMGRLQRVRTGLDVCLLMSLWIMGNLSSFRGAAVVFGVSKSTVHFHYIITIEALRELSAKFIKWPTAHQRNGMKEAIRRRTGFPGAVGMMDGMLVTVTAPAVQKARYFDRHHQYSYNVMLVCDKDLRVTFAYVGEAGSAHDSRVFQRSGLHDVLLERRDFLADDEHLLADGAYTLTNRVLTPYRNNGRLTPRQRQYNRIFSGRRVRIEHTNGRMKNKWRRLFRLHVWNPDYALDHLMAAVALHNFVLLGGREPDGMAVEAAAQRKNPPGGAVPMEHPLLNAARLAGIQKRDAIALLLHP